MNQFIQFHMNPVSNTNFILISFKKQPPATSIVCPICHVLGILVYELFQEWPDLLETLMTDARKLLKDCQKR